MRTESLKLETVLISCYKAPQHYSPLSVIPVLSQISTNGYLGMQISLWTQFKEKPPGKHLQVVAKIVFHECEHSGVVT